MLAFTIQSHCLAKFIHTAQTPFTGGAGCDPEAESPAIRMGAAACHPVSISLRLKTAVFVRQRAQAGIDGLAFTRHQPDLYVARRAAIYIFIERENLRSQHTGIRNSEQLKMVIRGLFGTCYIRIAHQRTRQDKEPGSIRRAVDMRSLHCTVQILLFRR